MPLPTLQKLNIAQPQPATMKLQAMKMQDMQKRTGLAEQGLELQREGLGLRKETLELNKSSKKLDNLLRFMPTLTKEEWQPFREHIKSIDPDLADLLPDDVSEMPDDEWNETVNRITFGAEAMSKMKQKEYDSTVKAAAEKQKQQATSDLEIQKQENRIALADRKADLKKTPSEKATAYTTPMNQILKEYGGAGGIEIGADGSVKIGMGSKKAYQDMAEKAKTDPKAKRDLATYEVLKKKLLGTTGTDAVEASTQKRLIFKDGQFVEK